jgi:hypothetical protein
LRRGSKVFQQFPDTTQRGPISPLDATSPPSVP